MGLCIISRRAHQAHVHVYSEGEGISAINLILVLIDVQLKALDASIWAGARYMQRGGRIAPGWNYRSAGAC